MTEEGFTKLIRKMIGYKPVEGARSVNWISGVFGWCSALIQRNACSRSELVDAAHLTHFHWVGDHMVSTVCKHKKDQDGSGIGKMKAIYANPLNPELCCILALGVFMISRSKSRDSGVQKTKLFEGKAQHTRYGDVIKAALKEFSDEEILQVFGTTAENLATHSIRKFIIDYLTSIIDGPNVCAVYIRAGWSLGNTQDRYILGGLGEDNLIGRYKRIS